MDFSSTTGKVVESLAAVAYAPREQLKVETIYVDVPKKGEVRVKMTAAGICHSDLTHLSENMNIVEFPVVLGHEGCGYVESVGPGVTNFKPGDQVIPLWKQECGKCSLCKNPNTNFCEMIDVFLHGWQIDGTGRMKNKEGKAISQLCGVGCFSEYCVMHECSLVKVTLVNSKAPFMSLPPFGCCFPTGYGAAVNTAGVTKGSTAVVFGLGSVGLCAVLGCKQAGAARIIGVDVNPDKSAVGRKFGCTDFVNPKDHNKPVQDVLKEMTGNKIDYSLVAVGIGSLVDAALSCVRIGTGKAVLIGLVDQKHPNVEISPFDLIWGKTLTGTWCGGCHCLTDIPKFVEMHMAGSLKEVDLLTTGVISLKEINQGFATLDAGKALRTIIKF